MRSVKDVLRYFVKGAMKIAADVGSEKHYILMRHPDGRKERKVFSIPNSRKGFEYLYEQIMEQKKKWRVETIAFGMESTGHYGEGIGQFLTDKGIKVVLINGFLTKRVKELPDNSPLKSDMKDPKVIADIMELGHVMVYWKPEGPAAEIRQLNRFREDVIKKRTVVKNQLHADLELLFPEFIETVGKLDGKAVQYLLSEGYHDPLKILAEESLDELAAKLRKISRGQKNMKTVEALKEAAKETYGIKVGKATLIAKISWYAKELAEYCSLLDELETQLTYWVEQIAWSKHLLSIPGFGLMSTAGVIGEIGDFNRFNSIEEVEKYAGLNLYEISSGKYAGTRRISKRGRCYLRKVLYLAALNQVRCNLPLKNWYGKMKDKGKHKRRALTAVMRKLLRICYGLVKSHCDYNAELFESVKNQEIAA